ncbi:MAG: ferredoxin [Solirubrobacteraceae bacterium]|nr:ferredoxin [Solirubrobacteraceae bacterium]MEA2392900.1 ferredoxin [Solirubrobacteraceae bacterium]
MSLPPSEPPSEELVLDPTACTGHGLCAELLPERIVLDDWGYPMIDPHVPESLHEHAVRAVRSCPALALALRRARADVRRS